MDRDDDDDSGMGVDGGGVDGGVGGDVSGPAPGANGDGGGSEAASPSGRTVRGAGAPGPEEAAIAAAESVLAALVPPDANAKPSDLGKWRTADDATRAIGLVLFFFLDCRLTLSC